MPPAVEAFMRSLAAYVSSSTSQTATLPASTEGAVGPKLSASSAAQKDVDQVPLPDERYAGEPDLLAAGDDLALPAAEEEAAKDQRVVEDKPVDEGETAAEDELAAKDEPVAKGDPAAEEQTAADETSSDSITATPPPITFVGERRGRRGFESVLRDWRSDDAGDVGRESLAQSDFAPQAAAILTKRRARRSPSGIELRSQMFANLMTGLIRTMRRAGNTSMARRLQPTMRRRPMVPRTRQVALT